MIMEGGCVREFPRWPFPTEPQPPIDTAWLEALLRTSNLPHVGQQLTLFEKP